MKVNIPYVVQDQLTALLKGMKPTVGFEYEKEGEVFLDGPVTKRVAIVDFTEDGNLRDGARFNPPAAEGALGRYQLPAPDDLNDPRLNQVSVLGTVLRTMRAFEEEDVLGRDLVWGFDGPQLLVVPRAGEWANAFYERDSRSLQFFYFETGKKPGKKIYTSLSHDIVAHETGHAILDGIAPDLYDAVTPQSLALHEAIADLTALVMALDCPPLRRTVLEQNGGRIGGSTALSRVAEEFGMALNHGQLYLRSLDNKMKLGNADHVLRSSPHDLSLVLSGALFDLLVELHEELKRKATRGISDPVEKARAAFSASGKAAVDAVRQFRRFIFRALDYLPPGEISFADYGRAVIAADQASYPLKARVRDRLVKNFIKRGIVSKASELNVRTNFHHPAVDQCDLDALIHCDWAAYSFANANRSLLRIPRDISFRVLPRLDVTKRTWGGQAQRTRECLFKVSWEHFEESGLDARFPARRAITVGTTLAIDFETKAIRARLTTDKSQRQKKDRNLMLARLRDGEILQPGVRRRGAGGHEPRSVLSTDVAGGILRMRGAGRTLHLTRETGIRALQRGAAGEERS